MQPQTYFHSIVQRIKQEKIGQRSWKSYFIMQESDCTVRITLRNFHFFLFCLEEKEVKNRKLDIIRFITLPSMKGIRFYVNSILKKYLHSFHFICIMILQTFFSKFCKVFITNYLFYELLVMEQTLVAISPSCNSNLHALPDYLHTIL